MLNRLSRVVSPVAAPLYPLVRYPAWIFSAPGTHFGFSVPSRVAMFAGLSLTVIVSILYELQKRGQIQGILPALNPTAFFCLAAVVILGVACASGLAVRHWLMNSSVRCPQIDLAWQQGLEEFLASEIELQEAPLFLFLGFPDFVSTTSFMQASGLKFDIQPVASGITPPFLWFSGEKDGNRANYLFLNTCCQTSLMSGRRGLDQSSKGLTSNVDDAPRGTLEDAVGSIDDRPQMSIQTDRDPDNEEIDPDESIGDRNTHEFEDEIEVGKESAFDIPPGAGWKTIDSDEPSNTPQFLPSVSKTVYFVERLTDAETNRARTELRRVCHLIKTSRGLKCPINGVISTVPFQMLASEGDSQGRALGDATRDDLKIVMHELGMRAHIIALVHGLDVEEDFRVFVKRMREFQSASDVERRIGKGLGAWVEINRETVESLAICACDAFQRLIYKFFSSTQSLKRVDNGNLYRFLAKIRGKIEGNLKGWLGQAFAPQSDGQEDPADSDSTLQLAGCYFVAAQPPGEEANDEDRLFAHVPGVFERLAELEREIAWTKSEIEIDSVYRNLTNLIVLLTLASLIVVGISLFQILS